MKRQKILITGAAGFIGSSLLEALIADGNYSLVAIDNLSTGTVKNLPKENPNVWKLKICDVNIYNDIEAIMLAEKFDYVFHYAAVVGVKRTLQHPLQVLQDIEGTKNILKLSQLTGVKRIFYASSSEVYGEPVALPEHEETTPLNARLPYAVVKHVGEVFLQAYQKEYGLSYTIFRFFNTFGPRQSEDFVISKFIEQAKKGEPLTIYGDGKQTRTFCYIDDNIATTLKLLKENLMVNETLNIGNDHEISILDLAQLIIRLSKSHATIAYLPARSQGDMKRRQPDISKMKHILRRDLISLQDGLQKLL